MTRKIDLQAVVERVTREIITGVRRTAYGVREMASSPNPLPPSDVRRPIGILVVFSGSEGHTRETAEQLRQLGEGLPMTLVVPRWARGLFGALAQAQPEWRFLAADGERLDPQELLLHHDLVVVPDLNDKTARQLSLFQGSGYPANIILGALWRQKRVVLGAEIDGGRRNGNRDALLDNLRQMGLIVTETRRLAATCRGLIQACSPCLPEAPARCDPLGRSCGSCSHALCVQKAPRQVDAVMAAGADRISATLGISTFRQDLASLIDHTLLKPEATEGEISQLCAEARQYGFASVCINPTWIELCARLLTGSGVRVCTVIGFPLGANTAATKAFEARDAIARGAGEVDMVVNIGALKSGLYRAVEDDIRGVVEASQDYVSKVILETCLLTDEEKVLACQLAKAAGATFVKTSTGFSKSGASVHDVALMRRVVGPEMGVKASGGIRDCATAEEMVQAGATRIGASASVAIARCEVKAGKREGY